MNRKENTPNIIPAVEKTLDVILLLAQDAQGKTRNEIADKLNIASSTCYRILNTLAEYQWIKKDANAKYSIDTGLEPVADYFTNKVFSFRNAQNILDELALATHLSCKLSVRRGLRQYVLARAESPSPFSISGKAGVSFPLAEGSVGAALLALTDSREIIRIAQSAEEDINEKIHPENVACAIGEIRQKGYTVNTHNNRWKIGAMSIPIIRNSQVAAAITLMGHESDFKLKKNIEKYLALMKKAAKQL